ncbi:MAG: B12-binding domain-containing radical SAM protein [Thermoplasmatales archaeon]|nr:MAG: B12-binding domain-containing radical SAM protein [Thermoplasmatales archaeon]
MDKFIYTYALPSITLEQLISITPDKYEVECVDERWENVDLNWDGNLVGISTLTLSANHAYKIADEFRRRGKTVVLGGYHPSALPEEAKQHADSVVIGEAEISWPKLLRDFENGELKPFYRATPVEPEMIPSPKRSSQNYSYYGMVQATRGCPHGCSYCAVQKVEGINFRARPIRKVIKEIESLQTKRLFFADSSLTINSNYTKQLFQEMIGLNKKFSCYGNINVLCNDDELLNLAKKAGCETWLIGFESVSQDSIKFIGKKTNKVIDYASGVKKINNFGMMVTGLFMFGFDPDKPDIFKTTLKAINKMKLNRVTCTIVTPYPGTTLFNELEKEGRILTKDWSKYNLTNVVFLPKNISEEQLIKGRISLVKEFYSLPNCLKRSFQDKNTDFNRFVIRTARDYLFNNF